MVIKQAKFTGTLMPYQQDVLNKLKTSDAVLAYHGLGSGKTATSIAASEGQPTDVVVPASLRGNYSKEIHKFTNGEHNRNILSYNKFVKEPKTSNSMLVLDEPQKIGRTSSAMSQAVVHSAERYGKRLLLSGTPATNNPAELAPIIRTLSPKSHVPLSPAEFNQRYLGEKPLKLSPLKYMMGMRPGVEYFPKHTEEIKSAIKGKVSYYQPPQEDYPKRIDVIKKVPASQEQAHYYSFVTENANPVIAHKVRSNLPLSKQESTQLNAFMSAARQVSNTTKPFGGTEEMSPKIRSVVEDFHENLKKNPNHKGVIYSNYLAGGINEVSSEFKKRKIPHDVFTGEANDVERKRMVEDYNSGKTKALLISSSGAEGLDLKGTRSVQIMEPHWNKSRVEQVIGRGIRYKSHAHLPENERNVTVTKYQTTLPKTLTQKIFFRHPDTSADEYLENLSNKKQETLNKFLDIFKEEGMQKSSSLKRIWQNSFNDEIEKIASGGIIKILKKNPEIPAIIIGGGVGALPGIVRPDVQRKRRESLEDYRERSAFAREDARADYWKSIPKHVGIGAAAGGIVGLGLRQMIKGNL